MLRNSASAWGVKGTDLTALFEEPTYALVACSVAAAVATMLLWS